MAKPNSSSNARDRARGADKPARAGAGTEGAQLSFPQKKTWGGRREGAGRKPGVRPKVQHVPRPVHQRCNPVLVTLRRAKGLPSLRGDLLHDALKEAVRQTQRDDFRIAHYSIQTDHVLLVVEADDSAALSTGMKAFAIRAALLVNFRALGRKRGRVWGDRHHRRELTSPGQVRNALVYVLNSNSKHGEWEAGAIDPCSSGPWFRDWVHAPEPPTEPSPVSPAQTWLLRRGWHDDRNFLDPLEAPRG